MNAKAKGIFNSPMVGFINGGAGFEKLVAQLHR